MRLTRALTLTVTLTGLIPNAAAQTEQPARTADVCPAWQLLNPADLRAARVKTAHAFLTDVGGKAQTGSLNRDDLLLQGGSQDGRRCSYLIRDGQVTGRAGFLSNFQVQTETTAPTLNGRWQRPGPSGPAGGDSAAELNLSRTPDGLNVQGGPSVPGVAAPLSGVALTEQPGRWALQSQGCRLNLYPVGPWLVVAADAGCGDLSAAFGGLYSRVR